MAEPARPAAAFEYPPLHGGKLLFLTAAIATASFTERESLESAPRRQFRVLRVRLRHFLGRHPERHRGLCSICHAAFPAGVGDRIFLPAVESNNAVRNSAERLGIRLGSE